MHRNTAAEIVATESASNAPAWTYRKPEAEGSLFGMAKAPITSSISESWDVASQLATDDLMLAAKADVKTWAWSQAGPLSQQTLEQAWEVVLWDEQETITVELASFKRHEDLNRSRIWALAELDRPTLIQSLNAMKAETAPQARDALKRAKGHREKGHLVSEIKSLAQGLALLMGPMGLVIPSQDGKQLLRTEFESSLLRALKRVSIQRVKGPESLRPGDPDSLLMVETTNEKAAVSIPIRFEIVEGEGQLGKTSGPDNRGRSQVKLSDVAVNSPLLNIKANPDVAQLSGGTEIQQTMLRKATALWALPELNFPIEIIPLRLLLSYIEQGGSGGQRGTLLMSELTDALAVMGAKPIKADVQTLVNPKAFSELTKNTRSLDLEGLESVDLVGLARIELKSLNLEDGSPPVHTATGKTNFYLFDVRNQTMLLAVSIDSLQFSGFSQADAERGFFLQASDRLRDLVVHSLADDLLD